MGDDLETRTKVIPFYLYGETNLIKYVIKNNGTTEPFSAEKLNKWAAYATKYDGNWAAISTAVYRLLPETVSSKDIHSTMTRVCSDIGDLTHSRIAARLEIARLRKNMERYVGVSDQHSVKDIIAAYVAKGLWKPDLLPEYNPEWEEWYTECKGIKKHYWELLQWSDKYSLRVGKDPVETPHVALLASALVLHGDTKWAKEMYIRSVNGKLSLPTPALNGIRNGDFDTISCSLIEGGDTTDSILVANHLAAAMTAKQAGIGIFHHTRSAGDDVRNGEIEHLGKHGIFRHVESAVKVMKHRSRGGSATATVLAIDPEIEQIITWKSQRSAIDIRIDQIDYTFSYNDAFVDAVVANEDWHLFSLYHAPEVHDAFYGTIEEFNKAVETALVLGKPHKKIKARELLKLFLTIRIETGRLYSFNASRVNTHTPYNQRIHQSNLCLEIVQPTAPFKNMRDLVFGDENGDAQGEISFCGLSAVNYSQIDVNDPTDVQTTIEIGVRTVTRMIEMAPGLFPPLKKKMMERMNVGLGITGLADAVYKAGLDYDGSDEFYEFVRDLAEAHTFYAYKTSQDMYNEGNREVPQGINLDWLPIDTAINAIKKPFKMDWESLRGKPRAHSVLVSIQPCESSSVFSGGMNSVYPARSERIGKQSRAGIVQQVFVNFDKDKHTTAWDVPTGVMSMVYSCIQDCIDQAISADEFFDPQQYDGGKRPLSEYMKDFIRHARLGNKTQYYINTRVSSSDSQINESAPDCEECKM